MAELPQNWQKEYLTNICNVYQPKTISTKELLADGSYPVYGANGQIGYYDKYNHEFSEVLITCRGATCGNINKSVPKSWINGNAMVASPISNAILDKNYLFYYLKNTSFADYISGTAQPQITRTSLTKMPVIYPPLNEQKHIVEKLDKIIRIVDGVNARLDKIPTALKRARQSILNQAITGELTKDWRAKNNIQITKDDLKLKIQTELNSLYRNKKITKENSQIKIEDIMENSCSSWFNIKARFLCHHITKGTTPKQILEIGAIPYLKVYNIVNNKIDFSYKPQFVSFEIHNTFLERSKVYPNDVVMNIVGPPLGKVAIIPNDYKEWNINQALAIFRPIKYLLSEYVYIVLSCDSTLLPVLPDVKGIVGQSNISLEQCRNLLFPLPPLGEQAEIVRRVKLAFEKLDKIESRYQKAKEYFDKLTQSILNKAFRGELVPQDPNDKPISLDDIQVQIAEKPSKKEIHNI